MDVCSKLGFFLVGRSSPLGSRSIADGVPTTVKPLAGGPVDAIWGYLCTPRMELAYSMPLSRAGSRLGDVAATGRWRVATPCKQGRCAAMVGDVDGFAGIDMQRDAIDFRGPPLTCAAQSQLAIFFLKAIKEFGLSSHTETQRRESRLDGTRPYHVEVSPHALGCIPNLTRR